MKRLVRLCVGVCVVAIGAATFFTLSKAATLTPNLSLSKPTVGESGWGSLLNSNTDTLDAQFGAASGHDHTAVAGKGPRIPISGGGTFASSAAGARTNLGAAASGGNTDITALTGLTGNAIGVGVAAPDNSIQIHKSTGIASTMTFTNSDTGVSSATVGGRVGLDSNEYMTLIGGSSTLGIKLLTNNVVVVTIDNAGALLTTDTIKSSRSTDLGWTVQNATNQACNTTCTGAACVVGIDTATPGVFLPCGNSTSDSCVCAG